MGKKKQKPEAGNDLMRAMMAAAMAGRVMGPEQSAKAWAAGNERLVQGIKQDKNSGTVRRVTATRSMCHCPARDEVVIVTPSAMRQARALEMASKHDIEPVRSIVVYVVAAHEGSASPAELDIEDAKKLVNALSEAIAETERITAQVAS